MRKRILDRVKKYRKVFSTAKTVLEILEMWRRSEAGVFGSGLAVVASFDPLVDLVQEWNWGKDYLDNPEYRILYDSWTQARLATKLLKRVSHPMIRTKEGIVHVWADGGLVVVEDKGADWLLVKRGGEEEEVFQKVLRENLYVGMRHLFLAVPGGTGGEIYMNLDVYPYVGIKRYVGVNERYPEEIALRLKREGNGSLLIVGPTGVGKSFLARHVSEALGERSLTVSGDTLGEVSVSMVLSIVEVFRPGVVILDDIPNSNETRRKMLAVTEALHERGEAKVILTLMTDREVEIKRGAAFIDGLRPGRVDEVLILNPPDEEGRKIFLKAFLDIERVGWVDWLAKRSEGLSPAYLRELGLRVNALGAGITEGKVQEELDSLLLLAPPLEGKKADGGKKAEEPNKSATVDRTFGP